MEIAPAAPDELREINRLIADAKSVGPWPPGYLEAALPFHVISPGYLDDNLCFRVADAAGRLVAFFSVAMDGDGPLLYNLWVAPDASGRGVGRLALEHLFSLARLRRWTQLRVLPDPPAEGFYLGMGFLDTGARAPSRVAGGPTFKVLRKAFV